MMGKPKTEEEPVRRPEAGTMVHQEPVTERLSLRKSHLNNNWLKEEREKLLQEKDKLRRMAEPEIE